MAHTIKHANLFQRLFKRCPPTPPARYYDGHGVDNGHCFDTVAQIDAYASAFFDRIRYRSGLAADPHIAEPGLERDEGYVDLSDDPRVEYSPDELTATVRKRLA